MKVQDIFAFRPIQVTVVVAVVYVVLFAALLQNHLTVPAAPDNEIPLTGINQTQAWRDLQELSRAYRPWNSARNGEVRDWLSDRIETLVRANGHNLTVINDSATLLAPTSSATVVLCREDDLNVTIIGSRREGAAPAYIESQNIMLYVRGAEDEEGAWWTRDYQHRQGVLVDAHYDSVSTGYGATDDGVGVITVLQLMSHFTTKGNEPRRGIIFLLNDGEEDGLYGASTFTQHPWSSFPGVFLNLEGAGAGGRAALFRSTDTEVTGLYKTSNPFGTVLTADGFKRGLVRSDTDYSIFTRALNIRGLDVAFVAPRARYHTNQDAAPEVSKDSIWHMLSMAISTTRAMAESSIDWKPLSDVDDSGVWFDVFGNTFVLTSLHTFSALCISALVIGPVLLGAVILLLVRFDKWYPFLATITVAVDLEDEVKQGVFYSRRGLLRVPIVLVASALILAGLADFISIQNPYLMYRSPFLLWGMFMSSAALISWVVLKLADHTRSTVFTRWYSILWLYIISWTALVGATNGAIASQLGGGYPVLIFNGTSWLALLIGTVEFAVLPRRSVVAQVEVEDEIVEEVTAQVSEQTPLLRTGVETSQTFTGIARVSDEADVARPEALLASSESDEVLGLTSWVWLLQFLILAPANIVIVGQIALFTLTALHQTPADGNPLSTIFQAMILFGLVIIAPVLPVMHKLRASFASLLLLVFLYCLLWSSLAEPFSRDARLKYYYLQSVDLESRTSNISLTAVELYLHTIIDQIPSAAGKALTCSKQGLRPGLPTCTFGADPAGYDSRLVHYNISDVSTENAMFTVYGNYTKSCRILFDSPVEQLLVNGALLDIRNTSVTTHSARQIRMFSRDFDKHFVVNVTWPESARTRTGRIGCVWSELEYVDAIKEMQLFAPPWSALTKHDDGLVEGWYDWSISGQ